MNSTKRTGLGGVEDTLRNFWETRPVRPLAGGKVGGVAAAIGVRYGIDPILVRVAFVLAALYGGAGLVLYLLGWLLFPKEGDPAPGSAEPTRQPTSTALAVVLVVLLVPVVFWLTSSPSIIGLALGLGALYLVHRNYGDRGVAPAAPTPADAPQPTVPVTDNTWVYPGSAAVTAPPNETPQQTPPAWDPLGAAPFAWDLPEPNEPEEPEPQRPRRRWISFATLGLAAFFGGLAATLGARPDIALAIALGVLGLGMIAGAFLRGGRGLIGAAIPVGALAMLLAVVPPDGITGGLGNEEITPSSIEQVQPHYQRSAGSLVLNMQDLRIADGQELRTGAKVGFGDILVRVPPKVDVTARCAAEIGGVQCLRDSADGRRAERSVVDQGDDGPGGGNLVLDLTVGAGNVEVIRG
ncbi:PspC domain-containing protein [Saccharopolyspora phatthalungensis]|uniref:Phage shock protein PspC (Stress-responsive transcriptional regulator) n=1 Tax=Saccharopolyspora phatthalungensis TaxID=664693 RepID=A0A840Q897_9PSEU|nr:PspC domain-containing protein [Saccharopolyspora phatthalungensis]MBB5154849.1 phage shock protein PspC (stress-responsive transcriptional regulator) [Saccharopolyspora phatthalungensis]